MKKNKFLFGPVPSRRLGISLGVDLGLKRQCSLDCVYCEVGKTSTLSLERDYFANEEEIIAELKAYLNTNPKLDYITFSGTGEPTLSKSFLPVISFIKTNYPQYKVAVLTNTTTIIYDDVKKALAMADLILPSLDSVTKTGFEKINRPANNVNIDEIITHLTSFAQNYKGKMWLEVFIIEGINDSETEINALKQVLLKINPQQVQLNTLDRPGTEAWVKPASKQTLQKIQQQLQPLNAVIIGKFASSIQAQNNFENIEEQILSFLAVRPATLADLEKGLGLHVNLLNKHLRILEDNGKIKTENGSRGVFYKLS